MPHAEWRVLIADDEPAARRGIRQLLKGFPEFGVAAECRSGDEVLSLLDRIGPDVVFLDIQMPGADGLEVIRQRTPERMPLVVFVTAYDQFAIRAFEAQALDYLVKPVSQARFAATLARLTKLLRLRATATAQPEPTFAVSTGRGTKLLRLGEIEWIEAADNYARLWCAGRGFLLRQALSDLELRLRPHHFVRAHRRALIPLAAVSALEETDGTLIAVLRSGVRVPVSRRRQAAFVRAVRQRAKA